MEKDYYKILVVDDSPAQMEITIRPLQKAGYKTFSARNGTECLEILAREKPDIILLDIILSDTDGKELCRKIKSNPEYASIFIILLSSLWTSSDNIAEGLEEGADGYIIRPVESRELLARIKSACRILRAERKTLDNKIIMEACINSPQDLIVLAIDKNYKYLTFNRYHEEIMLQSYGKAVAVGMNIFDCMTNEEDIAKAKINYDKAISGVRHITVEEYGEIKRQYFETRYNPILNERNEIIGATAFSVNVTDRKQMEFALKESETRYRELIEMAPDGILLGSSRGIITGANTNMQKLSGRGLDELIDLNITVLFSDDELNKVPFRYDLLAKGETVANVRNLQQKNGSVIPVEMHTRMMPDGSYQSVIHDISWRRQTESEILRLGNHFQALIEKAPDGIVLLNSEGRFKYISPSAMKYFEYDISDKIPDNPAEFTHPDDLLIVLTEIGKTLEDPAYAPTVQYRFATRSGNWMWIESTFSNMLSDPAVESIVLNFRIINDRKLAEHALKESERLFRTMVETVPLAIHLSVGQKQKTEYVNPQFIRLLGYTLEDLPTSQQWWPLAYPDKDYRTQIKDEWDRRVKLLNEKGLAFEPMKVEVTCKDGSKKNISWGYISFGDVNYTFGLDMTMQKKAEDDIHNKIEELEWFNSIMVNREVKMIELKKEINALLVRQGEQERYVIHELGE